MLVLNKASRYHLCIEGLRRAPRYKERARELIKMTEDALDAHRKYVVEHLGRHARDSQLEMDSRLIR